MINFITRCLYFIVMRFSAENLHGG